MKAARGKDEMRTEYDFTGGERGKYARRYAKGTNVIVLDPDVAAVFKDSKTVNEILRGISSLVRKKAPARPSLEVREKKPKYGK
jgi:hypothetical protein